MRSCLVAYVKYFEESMVRHICKMENLKSELLLSTSVRKECLPKKFMKTSWKPLGRNLFLIAQLKIGSRV